MERKEINIVIAVDEHETEWIAAFPDRDRAFCYFKRLHWVPCETENDCGVADE